MAILAEHIPYLDEIFRLDGFLRDPVLEFGYHDFLDRPRRLLRTGVFLRSRLLLTAMLKKRHLGSVRFRPMPATLARFQAADLPGILRNHGCGDLQTLDLFDARADYRLDMNDPLPPDLHARFMTVIDIGSTEHVFDTRQCLANLFNLVRDSGHLLLHTPCLGHFNHGFHSFSPECLLQALELNGFEPR